MNSIKQIVISIVLVVVGATALATALPSNVKADCADVSTSIIHCSQGGGKNSTIEESGVWGILILAINILSIGVGIAAVAGIAWGAVLYTSAGGSVEQVKKARGIIVNVVIGLVAYAFMYAFLNFITPGGIFN